jgi:hypothetical protein
LDKKLKLNIIYLYSEKGKINFLILNKLKKYMNWTIYNKIVGSICPNYNLTIRIKILKVHFSKISILWINRNTLWVKL